LTLQSALLFKNILMTLSHLFRGHSMHLVQRVAAVVLTLGLSASLVGCGFHLKGKAVDSIPVQYSRMSITVPTNAANLEEKLALYLSSAGVQLSDAKDAYNLRVVEYTPHLLQLAGTLRQNILRVTVTFRIENAAGKPLTEDRTIMATRSYQYDAATVNTDNLEEQHLREMLIDDIAQQIARQISSNRLETLPEANTTSTTSDRISLVAPTVSQ
jgi:LPS-assembly lipoprotein